jgi:predicted GNAT family acetyltransferase
MRGVAAAILVLAGCSSAGPSDEPSVQITQLSNVSLAARHVTGAISVQYRVNVTNNAAEPMTLKRIDLQSIGYGAYTLPAMTQAFDQRIDPRQSRSVEVWGPAVVESSTIAGANGPVTLRAVIHYQTAAGTRQVVHVQQVHAAISD